VYGLNFTARQVTLLRHKPLGIFNHFIREVVHAGDNQRTFQQFLRICAGGVGLTVAGTEVSILAAVMVDTADKMIRARGNADAISRVRGGKGIQRQQSDDKDYCQQER